MNEKILEYKILFSNKRFIISFFTSIVLLTMGLIVNYYAGTYATESASSSVTDIILSNTRVYDLDGIFIYGTIGFFIVLFFICLNKPRGIPYILKSVALFYMIRSVFISLTHIGPFPSQIVIHSNLLSKITFGGDLFFSGHTGLPFLMALIFWQNKILRYAFILSSLSIGTVVLLSHMHYSIDVLAAFFITYTIFHIAEYFFKKDREMFFSN